MWVARLDVRGVENSLASGCIASPGNMSSFALTPCCDAEPIINKGCDRERERGSTVVGKGGCTNDYFTFVIDKRDPIYCLVIYFTVELIYHISQYASKSSVSQSLTGETV